MTNIFRVEITSEKRLYKKCLKPLFILPDVLKICIIPFVLLTYKVRYQYKKVRYK